MKNIDIVFNSQTDKNGKSFQIASGHISKTAVLFENEAVVAVISAEGMVEFYNTEDSLLAKGELPKNSGGREVYEEAFAYAENNLITLKFPIYEWIDNYPNCDGEYDRWDSKKIGESILEFNKMSGLVRLV